MSRACRSRPNAVYRVLRVALGTLGHRLFRIQISGLENLPPRLDRPGDRGWICAAVPHRNWSEPFILFWALPAEPPLVAVADGPTVSRSRLRRVLIDLAGGVVEVWPGAERGAFESHLKYAKQVIDAGAVLLIFPEKGGPSRPPQLRRVSSSVAHLAAHCQAPVVPVVLGGTHELYLRRRIELRILPALEPPTTDAHRAAIEAFVDRFRALTSAAAAEVHSIAENRPPRHKRWLWLTGNYPRSE